MLIFDFKGDEIVVNGIKFFYKKVALARLVKYLLFS